MPTVYLVITTWSIGFFYKKPLFHSLGLEHRLRGVRWSSEFLCEDGLYTTITMSLDLIGWSNRRWIFRQCTR